MNVRQMNLGMLLMAVGAVIGDEKALGAFVDANNLSDAELGMIVGAASLFGSLADMNVFSQEDLTRILLTVTVDKILNPTFGQK